MLLGILDSWQHREVDDDLQLELAARLPPSVRFGTSSWTYPGWHGLIYHGPVRTERALHQDGLPDYAAFPWFRAVGIDSTFYAPPKASVLERYSRQLPAEFRWTEKVWERISAPTFPRQPRYGERAGQVNPDFLDAQLFRDVVLGAHGDPGVALRTGPFLLEIQSLGRPGTVAIDRFFERLDTFLGALAGEARFAVEIRSPELLVPRYFATLNHHGATHVWNHWDRMPALRDQMRAAAAVGGLTAPFYVARLLTPLRVDYRASVERFAPFDRLQSVEGVMRADVVRLVEEALDRNAEATILVNNRVEGCAPRTIAAIGAMIVQRQSA